MSDEKFWLDDPTVLINKDYLLELIPLSEYSFLKKMNALTRLILLLTILGFFFSRSLKLIFSTLATLAIIAVLYRYESKNKEGFDNSRWEQTGEIDWKDIDKDKKLFTLPTAENPYMNRLSGDDPKKKPALPMTSKVEEEVKEVVKENPHFLKDPRLYASLGDNFQLEQSLRQFYTVSNTKLPNDQKEFAKFCYGNMRSCKGGDLEQCLKISDGAISPSP